MSGGTSPRLHRARLDPTLRATRSVTGRPGRALVVTDRDDPDAPAELVEHGPEGFEGA